MVALVVHALQSQQIQMRALHAIALQSGFEEYGDLKTGRLTAVESESD